MTAKLDNCCWKNYVGRGRGYMEFSFFFMKWNITSLLFSGAMYFTEWSLGLESNVGVYICSGNAKKYKYKYMMYPFFYLRNCLTLKRGRVYERFGLVLFYQTKFIFIEGARVAQ